MQKFLEKLFNLIYWIISGIRKRSIKENTARKFTNRVFKNYLKYLSGHIINVSGWKDSDKCGGFYKDYFGNVQSYTVSNIKGERGMPEDPDSSNLWIHLDLEESLPQTLQGKYDVVFCHTVLEHIFDLPTALENLKKLTKDIIVLVVPFSQGVHYTSSYNDYFRVTPLYLK